MLNTSYSRAIRKNIINPVKIRVLKHRLRSNLSKTQDSLNSTKYSFNSISSTSSSISSTLHKEATDLGNLQNQILVDLQSNSLNITGNNVLTLLLDLVHATEIETHYYYACKLLNTKFNTTFDCDEQQQKSSNIIQAIENRALDVLFKEYPNIINDKKINALDKRFQSNLNEIQSFPSYNEEIQHLINQIIKSNKDTSPIEGYPGLMNKILKMFQIHIIYNDLKSQKTTEIDQLISHKNIIQRLENLHSSTQNIDINQFTPSITSSTNSTSGISVRSLITYLKAKKDKNVILPLSPSFINEQNQRAEQQIEQWILTNQNNTLKIFSILFQNINNKSKSQNYYSHKQNNSKSCGICAMMNYYQVDNKNFKQLLLDKFPNNYVRWAAELIDENRQKSINLDYADDVFNRKEITIDNSLIKIEKYNDEQFPASITKERLLELSADLQGCEDLKNIFYDTLSSEDLWDIFNNKDTVTIHEYSIEILKQRLYEYSNQEKNLRIPQLLNIIKEHGAIFSYHTQDLTSGHYICTRKIGDLYYIFDSLNDKDIEFNNYEDLEKGLVRFLAKKERVFLWLENDKI